MTNEETRDLLARLHRAALEAMKGPTKAIAGSPNTRAGDSLSAICEEVGAALRRPEDPDPSETGGSSNDTERALAMLERVIAERDRAESALAAWLWGPKL